MTTSEQIRVLCVRSGVSLSELARRINQTPQNFSVKLKRNTVTQDELNQIANVLNVKYEQYFVLANGDQVSSSNRTELSPLRHSEVYSVDSDRLRNKPVPKAESSCIQHVLFVFLLLEIYKGYCERCRSAFYLLIKY